MAAGGLGYSGRAVGSDWRAVQGLLEKELYRGQPLIGKGSGPSHVSSDGGSGKPLLRKREETKRGSTGKSWDLTDIHGSSTVFLEVFMEKLFGWCDCTFTVAYFKVAYFKGSYWHTIIASAGVIMEVRGGAPS